MTSPRSIWRADPKGVVSGYTRAAKNLIQTVVRNAGHYVRRPAASRPFLFNPRAAAASESVLQVNARVMRWRVTDIQCRRCPQISLRLRCP